MSGLALQLFTASTSYFIAIAVCLLVEAMSPLEPFEWKTRFKGLYLECAGRLVRFFTIPPIIALLAIANPWRIFDLSALPPLVNAVIAILLVDFLAYWEHRFEHRFMWPVHMVHHVPRVLHAANSWGHPLQYIPIHIFRYMPLALFDFGGVSIPLFIPLLMQVQAYWVHSQTRVHLGPLRAIFVDNRFHRIHHGIAKEHHNRNFGIVFSFWDRLFRTSTEPVEGEHPAVGVAGVEPPRGALGFLAMPFVQAAYARRSPVLELPEGSESVFDWSGRSSEHLIEAETSASQQDQRARRDVTATAMGVAKRVDREG